MALTSNVGEDCDVSNCCDTAVANEAFTVKFAASEEEARTKLAEEGRKAPAEEGRAAPAEAGRTPLVCAGVGLAFAAEPGRLKVLLESPDTKSPILLLLISRPAFWRELAELTATAVMPAPKMSGWSLACGALCGLCMGMDAGVGFGLTKFWRALGEARSVERSWGSPKFSSLISVAMWPYTWPSVPSVVLVGEIERSPLHKRQCVASSPYSGML